MSQVNNRLQLIGNLGQDPELKRMESGRAVIRFSLATKSRWKDAATGEQREQTTWHTVKAWGGFGELLFEKLRKGHRVLLAGSLAYDEWEKDGVKQVRAYLLADEFDFLSPAPGAEHPKEDRFAGLTPPPAPQAPSRAYPVPAQKEVMSDEKDLFDDLPF